ncbi:MAG: zinc finger domain-containing protein [Candidatus Limnocylindrales bacterium]
MVGRGRDAGRVAHIQVGGRSTYLCPRCQPQPH